MLRITINEVRARMYVSKMRSFIKQQIVKEKG